MPNPHSLVEQLSFNFTVIPLPCVSMAMPVRANKESSHLGGESMLVSMQQGLKAERTI